MPGRLPCCHQHDIMQEEKCWAFQKGLSVEWSLGRVRETWRQASQLGSSCSDHSKLLPSSFADDLL